MKNITILYIPGLGGRYDRLRRIALVSWRIFGVKACLVPMNWYDGKPLAEKMVRVEEALKSAGKSTPVAIVGESAGASIALLAATKYKNIHTLITICGVTRPTTPISPYLQYRAPALPEAVAQLDGIALASSLSIHSLRSWYDPVVGKEYSTAPTAKVHTLLTPGHLFTILCCLTVFSGYVVRLTRNKAHLSPL